jgi:uncharacterized protein YqeY
MPSTYERIRADIIAAMKARDTKTATILRTCDAAIQRASMDQGKPIDEGLVITTLRKAVKNLSDARDEFAKAGRTDLVEANSTEIILLEAYLPKGLDAAQTEALVAEVLLATGATTKKDMGRVMGALKQHPSAGQLDFAVVSRLLQSKLA